jgi:hypothetical protein
MTAKIYNVEPCESKFAVIADNAERASSFHATQKEAIAEAKRLNPNAKPNVARVRNTENGSPDQCRKS